MHENAAHFRHPAGYSLPRVVAVGLAAACPFHSPRAADPAITTSTNQGPSAGVIARFAGLCNVPPGN
jgi:hypothetical protein